MSRTLKDQPPKFRLPKYHAWDEKNLRVPYTAVRKEWDGTIHEVQAHYWVKAKAGPKVKRGVINDWWWLRSEPHWWNHMCDEVPRRAECRIWERNAVKYRGAYIDLDTPVHPHAYHCYYW